MATYVNDLRLTEIATGDETGDWGDITNTNLELVAEAFSFGTEAITTNADTHTTTIADGATDPGRSIFLKYTGTLDSACTITIGPNTVSKLWLIENGTSGSQNIIISSGSGANITIPPGDTKAVYSDGAGSGAAMVDAFASLSVVDLKVQDDLTVTDDAAIGGLATVGGTLGVTGVLTANAGVVVDEMTIDADTITATDDFIIDAAAEIKLDADGGNITLQDGGTAIGQFQLNDTNHLKLVAKVSDADIFLQGNDGGSIISALRLDMSAAGAATFNSSVATGGGDGSGKIAITGGTATNEKTHLTFTNTAGAKTFAIGGGQSGVTNNGFVIRNVTDNNFPLVISDAGAATFNSSVTATSLDISGDIDVDGTTNLDVVDIDGAVDMATTLSVTGNVTLGGQLIMPDVTSTKMLVADGTSYQEVSISGDVTIANTGAVTIAANAVEGSMLNNNVISGQTALTSGLATDDELLVSDAGTLKRMDVSVLTTLTDDNATALAIALG